LNAPYSGKDGLIYAAKRHGSAHQIVYLEIEVRQDLIGSPESAGAIAERIARALEANAKASRDTR
jgi:predicted N-formylglutamate amidohydrolase